MLNLRRGSYATAQMFPENFVEIATNALKTAPAAEAALIHYQLGRYYFVVKNDTKKARQHYLEVLMINEVDAALRLDAWGQIRGLGLHELAVQLHQKHEAVMKEDRWVGGIYSEHLSEEPNDSVDYAEAYAVFCLRNWKAVLCSTYAFLTCHLTPEVLPEELKKQVESALREVEWVEKKLDLLHPDSVNEFHGLRIALKKVTRLFDE